MKGTFQLHETSQTEHEMCQYLEWELHVDPVTFREFEDMVKKYLVCQQLYPSHILPSSSQTTTPPTTNPFLPPPATLASTPTYGHCYPSLPKPDSPLPNSSYSTPPTLLSSAASPPTPPSMEDCTAHIVSASRYPKIPHPALPTSHHPHCCHQWHLLQHPQVLRTVRLTSF
ncbi:uncharacterized protein EDB93DRAFT_1091188 [Suillus bovinus]|uniref:uncharacterized protein n=1 Tax=Suillus bovinus TaxID=48563 RepID=UPI001B86ADF7|nr:uncharacterized protein EDB93DRAFT_1091188 [Suillus bovinus]KAG2137444.1 hypothetical protein EDB93DRAFT_1091188 [Suillus bovinus]